MYWQIISLFHLRLNWVVQRKCKMSCASHEQKKTLRSFPKTNIFRWPFPCPQHPSGFFPLMPILNPALCSQTFVFICVQLETTGGKSAANSIQFYSTFIFWFYSCMYGVLGVLFRLPSYRRLCTTSRILRIAWVRRSHLRSRSPFRIHTNHR